jgi:hypothetical protein
MDYFILTKDHKIARVDLRTWAEWFENVDNRRVALTYTDMHMVSTVFLGIDHSPSGRPQFFETMVFNKDGTNEKVFGRKRVVYESLDEARYTTWDEAVAGHATMVERWTRKEQEAFAAMKLEEWAK